MDPTRSDSTDDERDGIPLHRSHDTVGPQSTTADPTFRRRLFTAAAAAAVAVIRK